MRIEQATGRMVSSFEIAQNHPDYSFGSESDLSFLGYPTLEEVEQPTPDAGYRVVAAPNEEYEPGRWRQVWLVEVEPPPQEVSALQALLAIDDLGHAATYEAWSNDPARTFREKAFVQKAEVWKRNDPLFNAAADGMGFAEADKDAFFRLAALL